MVTKIRLWRQTVQFFKWTFASWLNVLPSELSEFGEGWRENKRLQPSIGNQVNSLCPVILSGSVSVLLSERSLSSLCSDCAMTRACSCNVKPKPLPLAMSALQVLISYWLLEPAIKIGHGACCQIASTGKCSACSWITAKFWGRNMHEYKQENA